MSHMGAAAGAGIHSAVFKVNYAYIPGKALGLLAERHILQLLPPHHHGSDRHIALNRPVRLPLKLLNLLMGKKGIQIYGGIVLRHMEAHIHRAEQLAGKARENMLAAVLAGMVYTWLLIRSNGNHSALFKGPVRHVPYKLPFLTGVGDHCVPNSSRIRKLTSAFREYGGNVGKYLIAALYGNTVQNHGLTTEGSVIMVCTLCHFHISPFRAFHTLAYKTPTEKAI